MKNLYVDGQLVTVDEVKKPSSPAAPQWCEVFVNNYSTRHSLPLEVCSFDRNVKFYTGGHLYEIK